MFVFDIEVNSEKVINKITNKTILVIGGAVNTGSSYIKTILPFLLKLYVVVKLDFCSQMDETPTLDVLKKL